MSGTFLVAAIAATQPNWLASGVWTIVGIAAVPSCAIWMSLSTRTSRPTLITVALVIQAVGIALLAFTDNVVAALISAVTFGGTFVGITTLVLAAGRHLGSPRAVAILTAIYGVGQMLGPLIVAPTLGDGYQTALLVGAGLVIASALFAGLVRIRYPHGRANSSTAIPEISE